MIPHIKRITSEIKRAEKTMNNASFTECTCEINNSQKDHVKGIDLAMLMYNFIEHSNNYFKTLGSLWKYYRNEPA